MKETKHVRILNTINIPDREKAMLGGIFEVRAIDYSSKLLTVYTDKEKTDFWHFNFSDVQEVCLEAVVDGYVLGVGDIVYDKPIIGFYMYDSEINVRSGTIERTCTFDLSNIELEEITPLYKPTIKIGEKLYNKSEVDTALANLKEIK